jgi:pimeloyl-ACP methyl ester carboxylesterase
MKNLRVWGIKPYSVAVIHGGPGAPGQMAPVARELSSDRGVLEPLQTKDTVDGQVEELREVLERNGDLPVTLIGHSWGAWLSYILAARYPGIVGKLILVGSGPFESHYAANIVPERLNRLSEAERIEALDMIEIVNDAAAGDKDKAMARIGELFEKADAYDPLPYKNEGLGFSYHINQKVWSEADDMRSSGRLLELGKEIRCPVVAIHGDHDPHLAEGVRVPLSRMLRDFRFILLEKCGHEPWMENFARDAFYEILRKELA